MTQVTLPATTTMTLAMTAAHNTDEDDDNNNNNNNADDADDDDAHDDDGSPDVFKLWTPTVVVVVVPLCTPQLRTVSSPKTDKGPMFANTAQCLKLVRIHQRMVVKTAACAVHRNTCSVFGTGD